MKRLAALFVLFAALIVVRPVDAQQSIAARIVDFELIAPTTPLRVGDTVTWTNEGERPHTVTDRGGLFDTGAILPGAQDSVTLNVPGTYAIFCEINPSKMNATLVVAPGDGTPTEVRVQAFDEARTGETKRFDPPDLEVASGTRLILANVGGLRHSLKAEDGSFAIPVVEPGAEAGRFAGSNGSVVVTAPGTHAYFCEIHPAAMKGTLVVTDTKVEAEQRAAPAVERPPPQVTVSIADFAFDPVATTVTAGGAVAWTNTGNAPHTATFDDLPLDTGRIAPGATGQVTAPGQPGTYSYRCSIHPKMRGVLVVPPERAQRVAAAPANATGDDTAGTLFAWVVAVLVVGVGGVGLVLGLRRPST